VHVARVESILAAGEILIPGALAVVVVFIGARLVVNGGITAGDLVAAYGYVAFLALPMTLVTEAVQAATEAKVAAGRVTAILSLQAPREHTAEPADLPAEAELADAESGFAASHGQLTVIAAPSPEQGTALARRLARHADGQASLGGVPLERLPLTQVREQIVLADDEAWLFSGTLGDALGADDQAAGPPLHAAAADTIVAALPEGLSTEIPENAMSFSGGERQRLRLSRALAAGPPVLVLIEPTSAVDSHTEAVIARRLKELRSGRTTIIVSTSPLVLDVADQVAFLTDGKVIATGTHRELLAAEPRYAATVMRGDSG
jgi:ABC-type bacteriocin/lantibiotic exporter with double-glycine peptidase domain